MKLLRTLFNEIFFMELPKCELSFTKCVDIKCHIWLKYIVKERGVSNTILVIDFPLHYFNLEGLLEGCYDVSLTSWRTCWRHDALMTSWRSFWCHEVFFNVMMYHWRHDEVFEVMVYFWCHDEHFDVMTFLLCLHSMFILSMLNSLDWHDCFILQLENATHMCNDTWGL